MPEGDSIAKIAARLRPRVVGQRLTGLWLRQRGPVRALADATVTGIETRGKHMLVRIDPRWVLHVHLGMYGRWRWFAGPGPGAEANASIVMRTPAETFVCRKAATAELRRNDDPVLLRTLRRLGPDLLAAEASFHEVVQRAMAFGNRGRTVAEILLDQRVAAGIGNVFKSEILFLAGVHPRTPIEALDDAAVTELFAIARRLLQANLVPGGRTTTLPNATGVRRPPSVSRHWVYRRHGLPCLRCRAPIQRELVGDLARSTYWCDRCQPKPVQDFPAANPN